MPPELLPEKFKNHPVYVRIIIDIIKSNRFDRLHLPLETTKPVLQIEEGAGVDWNKIANNRAQVNNKIPIVVIAIGAFFLLSGASVGVGVGTAIMATAIGLKSLSCMYSKES